MTNASYISNNLLHRRHMLDWTLILRLAVFSETQNTQVLKKKSQYFNENSLKPDLRWCNHASWSSMMLSDKCKNRQIVIFMNAVDTADDNQ